MPLEVTRPVRAHGVQVGGMLRRRLVLRGTNDTARPPVGIPELDEDVVERTGVRVTSPLRTCFDLMRERSLVEAVVVADAFLNAGAGQTDELFDYCDDRRRWPHVRRARTAARLAHAGARSPGETRLRCIVVLAGYPEPLVNVPVHTSDGIHLGTPDLTLVGRRWVHLEYDGAYHDEAAQHGRDLRRQNNLLRSAQTPLLRYDWRHVLRERDLVVHDVSAATGRAPRYELEEADFRRPIQQLRW